jgi:hypothetical protein
MKQTFKYVDEYNIFTVKTFTVTTFFTKKFLLVHKK